MHPGPIPTVLVSLTLVIVLVLASRHVLQWPAFVRIAAGPARPKRLAIRSVLALDPKRRLVLVSCDNRTGILLTGPHGDTFLGWQPNTTDGSGTGESGQ